MDVAIHAGRIFQATDDERAPSVAVVNDSFARLVFAAAEPSAAASVRRSRAAQDWAAVIGVVGDVHQAAVDAPPQPEMYRPFRQHPLNSSGDGSRRRRTGQPGAVGARRDWRSRF